MALTPLEIKAAQPQAKPYRLADGRSLFVVVHPSGSKSFEYRYRRGGTLRAIVLGGYGDMGLKEARDERDRLRAMLADGLDPKDQRRIAAEEQRVRLAVVRAASAERKAAAKRSATTVKVVAEEWVAQSKAHWTAKHLHQIEQSLRDHVYPDIGNKPVGDIDPANVLDLLGKLLAGGKVETARRVRQRLDAVFEYAGLKHKLPSNPVAVAKREINKRVKAARKTNPEQNFPCVPVTEVSQLLRAMRSYKGTPVTRSLLWFVALTGCRTGEARYATWTEFTLDGDDPHWLIPPQRMKAGREHRVPLAPAVVALLIELRKATGERPWVFPHPRRDDRPASENAVLYALAALNYKDRMTGHGFRALFSTIANESGLHRPDVIEAALAHTEGDDVRAAYNRASYADERRRLANWYADELQRLEAGAAAKVVSIKHAAA
jgi:integrase